MKRLSLVLLCGLAVAAAACGGGAPPPPVTPAQPNADSAAAERARLDSIERARQDSIRRAQEEADRIARQKTADSLAALGKTAEAVRTMLGTMIHFDFDKSVIRPDDAGVLDQKVAILRANPNLRIRISGHCDERGSAEYNLALGNRRANSSKQYLVSHGVEAARIETVSYGEERPIAQGHDESAWAQNRRDEFEITAGGDALKQP